MISEVIVERRMSKYDVLMVSRGSVVFRIIGSGEKLIPALKKIANVIEPDFGGKNNQQIEKIIKSHKNSSDPIILRYSDYKNLGFLMQSAIERKGSIIVIKN